MTTDELVYQITEAVRAAGPGVDLPVTVLDDTLQSHEVNDCALIHGENGELVFALVTDKVMKVEGK